MTLLERRRALMEQSRASSGRLPSAYQEVEWIKSSSRAYLYPGVTPKINPRIVTDVLPVVESNARRTLFGFDNSTNPKFGLSNYMWKASNVTFSYGSSNSEHVVAALKQGTNWVHIDMSNALIINGTTIKTFSQADFSGNTSQIRLFKSIGYDGIYSYKTIEIYDGAEKLRELVPCYRKSDTKIGLYDLITRTFYAGQGTFTKGADVI